MPHPTTGARPAPTILALALNVSGCSKRQLARACSLSEQTLIPIINGRAKPSLRIAEILSTALSGVPIDPLLNPYRTGDAIPVLTIRTVPPEDVLRS